MSNTASPSLELDWRTQSRREASSDESDKSDAICVEGSGRFKRHAPSHTELSLDRDVTSWRGAACCIAIAGRPRCCNVADGNTHPQWLHSRAVLRSRTAADRALEPLEPRPVAHCGAHRLRGVR